MRSEFEFINHIKSKFSLDKVGDDCAILPKDGTTDMLLTADMLVDGIDFRLEWMPPEFLGHKALAVSLSDVAAMGGSPTFAMLSLAVPERLWKSDFVDHFYSGWHELARRFGVELVGGDISKSPDRLVIDSTVGGHVPKGKAVLRSGASPGDSIFISGYIGGTASGLIQLESGVRFTDSLPVPIRHLLYRQLQPLPQIQTGNLLRMHGLVTSMIDISDGLSSDLNHLLNSSATGCVIEAEKLPIDPALSILDLPANTALDLAMNGGEDFELLFTVSPENISAVSDLGFHQIGAMTPNVGSREFMKDGTATVLSPAGYRHF